MTDGCQRSYMLYSIALRIKEPTVVPESNRSLSVCVYDGLTLSSVLYEIKTFETVGN